MGILFRLASATTSLNFSKLSFIVQLIFFFVKLSDAAPKIAISCALL
jgi:hypothetical protein